MLTQVQTLKSRLGLEAFDPTEDTLLTNILRHVSARFAIQCNRVFDYGAGVTFEFRANQMNIQPDRPPIGSVAGFEIKSSEAEGWLAQSPVDYLLSPTKALIELADPLGTSRQLGRVTYTGGYLLPGGSPGANQVPLPDEIEFACLEQAVYWYQRRAQLGLVSASNDSGIV